MKLKSILLRWALHVEPHATILMLCGMLILSPYLASSLKLVRMVRNGWRHTNKKKGSNNCFVPEMLKQDYDSIFKTRA